MSEKPFRTESNHDSKRFYKKNQSNQDLKKGHIKIELMVIITIDNNQKQKLVPQEKNYTECNHN